MHRHEIEMEMAEFRPGMGFVGPCRFCGVTLVHQIRADVVSDHKEHMSKKERLRRRRAGEPLRKLGHREDQ